MSSVAVIDYGMGNLHSIAKALQHAAPEVTVLVVSDKQSILVADRVVLPGVGAMRECMAALQENELIDVISIVAKNKPFLGVCLGMQALLTSSEENGGIESLNLIPGSVKHFANGLLDAKGERLKIPHMGWNQMHQHEHPLWANIPQNSHFYFVHSYFAQPDNNQHIAASTEYPNEFACAIAKDNIFATQFHPEKSHTAGLQLLSNFLRWDGQA
jgi:glutamine amidotransferase